MKKKWLKKAVYAGLALAMTAALAACGDKKDRNAGLAKENVYKFQEVQFPDFGRDYNIQQTIRKDDTIYMLIQVYHWNEEGYTGEEVDIRLLSMKEDGSDMKTVTLEMPKTDKTTGSGGSGIAVEPRASSIMAPIASVDIGIDMPVLEDEWEYTNYNNYTLGGDGGIYAIKNYNYERYSADSPVSIRKNYLAVWNPDGTFRKETELEGITSEEEWLYIQNLTVDADGTANIMLAGDSVYMMSVDSQGTFSGRTKLSEEVIEIFNSMDRMVDRGDGSYWLLYYDENDWSKEFIVSYDFKTNTLGTASRLPASFSWNGYGTMVAGKTSDLLYSNSNGLYSYNCGDTEGTMKMSYINSDLNITGFESIVEIDENRFLGVFGEVYADKVQAGIFTYVKPEEIADKSVLVLAGDWINFRIKQRVVEYNRNSEKYRIVVKDYSEYNTYEDGMAGMTQLNTDITTGNMPDILIASGLNVDNYAAKGLLADVGEMIKNDEELSKTEFMENVFDAYSFNGKLYCIIPSFSAQTLVAKKSIVGDRSAWTIKDMQDLMATLPEGTSMFGDMTRSRFFEMAMRFCGTDFVDVAAQKCYFDSEGFISMMEYAKTLPEELDRDYYGEDYWMKYESQYRENRTVLYQMYIGSIRDMNRTINGSFGEPVSYIGFPTDSGQGAYVAADSMYVISALSKHKEAAWDFMRYYLTDECQKELTYQLPIQKKYFMERAQEAMQKPYYINAEGEKIEYEESFYMNGESITLPSMSQEQIDEAVAMIESIHKKVYQNTDIINIINEDMQAFFSGQKSAQEVVKVIQSRAQIFVEVAE